MKFNIHLKDIEVFYDEKFGKGFDFQAEWYHAINTLPTNKQKLNLHNMINDYFFNNKLPEPNESLEYKLFLEMLG